MPFYPFLGEGSPTKIDCRKKVALIILTSLLEDLVFPFALQRATAGWVSKVAFPMPKQPWGHGREHSVAFLHQPFSGFVRRLA